VPSDRDIGDSAWRLGLLLFAANTLSFIDRQILTIMIDPVRAELQVSDTQISLLHGIAFASLYAVLGLPLGRIADRSDRPRLIALGIAIWSAMTAVSGMARDYSHLFIARMGVAVGEAALAPAAVSLLSDRFARKRLASAIGLFQAGIFVGSALALIAGGWVLGQLGSTVEFGPMGRIASWRFLFLAIGLPGILLAFAFLFVAEPRRRQPARSTEAQPPAEVLAWLWVRRRVYGWHFLAFTAITTLAYGTLAWAPSVLIRIHGMTTMQAGFALGVTLLIFGPLGVLSSGRLVDSLLARSISGGPVIAAVFGIILFSIATPTFGLASSASIVAATAVLLCFSQGFPYGVATASLALVTPAELRGQVTAIYLMISNLVGLSLGPLLVALATDRLFGDDLAIGFSFALLPAIVSPVALAALLALYRPYAAALKDAYR
jgi:MFS family permease